jgi:hypothetical protein
VTRHAFGLELAGPLEIPGTAGAGGPRLAAPPLVLEIATRDELRAQWPTGGDSSVARLRTGTGRVVGRTLHHPEAGFLMRAETFGTFAMDRAATRLRCAPVRRSPWPWERYVVAQALPFAALLRGLEVMHAGAVKIGDGAVALTAPSHGGKSTLLGAMLLRGAKLVADDVVALETAGEELLVHPGPGLVSLRAEGIELLGGRDAVSRLGPAPRPVPGGSWMEVERHPGPLPLRAFVVLRREADARDISIERVHPDPRLLLGSTFNAAWQEPARLSRQLDVCAMLSRAVPVLHLHAPLDAPPDELAAAVEAAA